MPGSTKPKDVLAMPCDRARSNWREVGRVAEGVGWAAPAGRHLRRLAPAPMSNPVFIYRGFESRRESGLWSGGGGGIRTHGTENRTLDFESSPFDHSGTPPKATHCPRGGGGCQSARRWDHRPAPAARLLLGLDALLRAGVAVTALGRGGAVRAGCRRAHGLHYDAGGGCSNCLARCGVAGGVKQ